MQGKALVGAAVENALAVWRDRHASAVAVHSRRVVAGHRLARGRQADKTSPRCITSTRTAARP